MVKFLRKMASLVVFFILLIFFILLGVFLFEVTNPLVFTYGWLIFAFALYINNLIQR